MAKLTAEQREDLFVAEYLKTLDATAAAIAAGLSKRSAKTLGSRMLQRPRVQELIRAKQTKQLQRIDMDAERIKQEIFNIATFDPAKLFDDNGQPLQIKDMPPEVRACIKRVQTVVIGQQVRASVEFWDKPAALTLAAKHLALLAPQEVTVNHRFQYAHLSDDELRQKLLEAAKESR